MEQKVDDEFDDIELPELSAEDWARIDAIEESSTLIIASRSETPGPLQSTSPPTLEVSIQPPSQPTPRSTPSRRSSWRRYNSGSIGRSTSMQRINLFTTFRRNGSLSVSDLVGPLWCEVKFDYNLRWGKRFDRVEDKPSTITTSNGKVIKVIRETAIQSEKTLEAGRAVHKKLERALQPEEVAMPITSKEERWATKLVTMLSGLQLLKTVGYCREFPVMGYIDNILISGIIDEVVRKPIEASLRMPAVPVKKEVPMPKPSDQTSITQFFSSKKPAREASESASSNPGSNIKLTESSDATSPTHILHLIDNKTRNTNSIPSLRDRKQSHLQLMIYKRLLDALLMPSAFVDILGRLSLRVDVPFSPPFIQSLEILGASNDLGDQARNAMCIADLVIAWNEAILNLGIPLSAGGDSSSNGPGLGSGIEDELELVYRTREKTIEHKKGGLRSKGKAPSREISWSSGTLESGPKEEELGREVEGEHPVPGLTGDIGKDEEAYALAYAIEESLKTYTELNERPMENGFSFDSTIVHIQENEETDDSGRTPEPEPVASTSHSTLHDWPMSAPVPHMSSDIVMRAHPRAEPESDDDDERAAKRSRSRSPTPLAEEPAHVQRSEIGLAPVIGVHKFFYDATVLDAHLERVFKFWRGEREAIGVDIEDSGRCNYCEFRDGCEWRAAKANELRLSPRRSPRGSPQPT